MTTVTALKAPNRVSLGEVNVGSGQLGQLAQIPNYTSFTQEYYSIIYGETTITNNVKLPIIGTGNNQVLPGWKIMLCLSYTNSSGIAFATPSSQTLTDNAGVNTLSIFYLPTSVSGGTDISCSAFTLTAVSAPATWDYSNYICSNTLGTSGRWGLIPCYFNGFSIPRAVGTSGATRGTIAGSINVLISTPTLLTFTAFTVSDTRFLTYATTNATTVIAGTYVFESLIGIGVSGGGTTTNVVMLPRKNGVNIPAVFTSTTGPSASVFYTLKFFVSLAVGDVLTIAAGKSVVSAGTTTTSSSFTIKYLG